MPHGRLGKPPWGVGRNGYESSDLGAVPVRPPHPGPTILACTVHVVRAVRQRALVAPPPFVIPSWRPAPPPPSLGEPARSRGMPCQALCVLILAIFYRLLLYPASSTLPDVVLNSMTHRFLLFDF